MTLSQALQIDRKTADAIKQSIRSQLEAHPELHSGHGNLPQKKRDLENLLFPRLIAQFPNVFTMADKGTSRDWRQAIRKEVSCQKALVKRSQVRLGKSRCLQREDMTAHLSHDADKEDVLKLSSGVLRQKCRFDADNFRDKYIIVEDWITKEKNVCDIKRLVECWGTDRQIVPDDMGWEAFRSWMSTTFRQENTQFRVHGQRLPVEITTEELFRLESRLQHSAGERSLWFILR